MIKLKYHSRVSHFPQHPTVDLKTHHMKYCHAELLIHTSPSQTHRSPQLSYNGRQTRLVANAKEMSKEFLEHFSADHEKNTSYNALLDGGVYATKMFP